jgi:hypothetical protein
MWHLSQTEKLVTNNLAHVLKRKCSALNIVKNGNLAAMPRLSSSNILRETEFYMRKKIHI